MFGSQASSSSSASSYIRCLLLLPLLRLDRRGRLQQRHRWRREEEEEEEPLCTKSKMRMSPLMRRRRLLRLTAFLSVMMLVVAIDGRTTGADTDDAKLPSGLGCEIPVDWRGRYFQSNLGMLNISRRVITTKGLCVERSADYFLFRNRVKNCFQCLLLLRQHKNVIQYKESYCSSASSTLKLVCTEIRVETPLYTLVREPALPVPCPFRESFYRLDFNDLSHGFCGRLASSAHRCSLPSRFQLNFSDCVKAARFQNKDIEMECLATWKDGSEVYLYSRLTGSGLATKDERYRCFKYQNYGSDVSMSMTADATCQGLRSSVDGPFLLELYKDESVVSQLKCRFPDWLKGVTWKTLNGKYRYRVEDDSGGGSAIYRAEESRPKDKSFAVFRCLKSQQRFEMGKQIAVIRSISIRNCSYFVQCLTLERISSHVIRFAEGKERDAAFNCQYEELGNYEILIRAGPASASCPNPGVHHTSPSGGCIHRLNIGCQDEGTILIDHSCSPGQPGLVFQCVASWIEGPRMFVVLEKSNDSMLHCFTFRHEGSLTIFGSDVNCHNSWLLPLNQTPLSYSILRHETCKRIVRATEATETTTTERTASRTTTNIMNHHFHHYELPSFDYEFEFATMSKDRREQQRPRQEDDDNNNKDDNDDDEYDDDDDDDYENTSIEFSGEALDEGLGGRRDVLGKYDEPFYSTQRQSSSSSSSSSYHRTKTSESRINKDVILLATNGQPPSTLFHFSVVLSNENKNFFDRREKGFRDRNRAVTGADISTDLLDSSSSFAASSSSSSSDESHLWTVSLRLLSFLVVFCVLARRDRV